MTPVSILPYEPLTAVTKLRLTVDISYPDWIIKKVVYHILIVKLLRNIYYRGFSIVVLEYAQAIFYFFDYLLYGLICITVASKLVTSY